MMRKNSWSEKINWQLDKGLEKRQMKNSISQGDNFTAEVPRKNYTSSVSCGRHYTFSVVPTTVTYTAMLQEVAVPTWLHIPQYRWSCICPCFRGGNCGQGNLTTCQRSQLRSVMVQRVNLNSFSPKALCTRPCF